GPDRLAVAGAGVARQVEDLVERRDRVQTVVRRVLRPHSGDRSAARSVLSSASVKSSVNQPVWRDPLIVFVVRRSANSGLWATSVVPPISFSWRATRTPSWVATRSGSM